MRYPVSLFLVCAMGWMFPFQASAMWGSASPVRVELLQEEETIQPGRPFWVALRLHLEEGWHVYWKNPGDVGIPLKLEWHLPTGFEAGPLQWPFPETFTVADMKGFGYAEGVTLLSQVTPPLQIDLGDAPVLQAQLEWLVCSSTRCQPGSASLSLPLAISAGEPQLRTQTADIFQSARAKIPENYAEVKGVLHHGVIELELPGAPSDMREEIIQKVDFFPEEQGVVDLSMEPTVALSSVHPNGYVVHLRESNERETESRALKGVLVLHIRKGDREKVRALSIDSAMHGEEEGAPFIGVLDAGDFSVPSRDVGRAGSLPRSSPSFEGGLGVALLFAFMGGILLNLMPCVLPVISFKVMSFVKMAGQSRLSTLKHGGMFSLGVILSFWALASCMLVLRAYGQAVGWGFQLQEPLFVVVLASVLFIFSLSLFGLFEWGMFLASWAGQTQSDTTRTSSGYGGSFLSGVLATAVATPCTGPFLGSAVGFAVTLPFLQSLLIFTFLGLGMCLPYLLLAAFPSCLRFLPKPGPWMETFKQLMGFLLLATVLWLLWVFSAQTNAFSVICLLGGFLCFSIGAWIYGKSCLSLATRKKRLLAYALAIACMLLGGRLMVFPRASWEGGSALSSSALAAGEWQGWESFSPERLVQLRREGTPVLIDFTAKWCLICQANHFVLDSHGVRTELDQAGVVKMKADWTKSDPVITEALSQFGRNSVPLYVLYGSQEEPGPLILPQVLTEDVVLENLKRAVPPQEIVLR